MHNAELRPLNLEVAAGQDFDPITYHPVLFCAESFEAMYQGLKDYLIGWR